MTFSFRSIVCACFLMWAQQAYAVVVDLSQVSDGEPILGTTISLETIEGDDVPLEYDIVELEDAQPEITEEPVPEIAETPAETIVPETPETPTPPVAVVEDPAPVDEVEEEKQRIVSTAVPVTEDGQARFIVDDQYQDEPLVLVVRDASGRILERRQVTLSGPVVSIVASALPLVAPRETVSSLTQDAGRSVQQQPPADVVEGEIRNDNDDQSHAQITMEAEVGRLERSSFNALRLQNGGVVLEDRFASVDRNGDFSSVVLKGRVPLGRPAPFFGTELYATGSLRYGYGSADARDTNVSSGDRDLGILGPEGPSGTLAGGAVVGGLNSDLDFVSYSDNYHEYMAQAGLSTMVRHGPVTITPRTLVFFGGTNESLTYSGRTNSNTLDFGYAVDTNSYRVGLQVGSEVAYEVVDGLSVFAGADARLVQNFADAEARLTLSGALNANEKATTNENAFDVGALLEAGLRFQRGRFSGTIGGRFETWEIPVAQITGEQPLYIGYESRTSYAAFARFSIALGAQPN